MSIEGGRQIFQQLATNESIPKEVRSEIAEHTGRIYELIDSKSGSSSNEELSRSLALLTNVFRTCTHSSHTELTPTQKLMFQHAFIDITNDVRTMIAERPPQPSQTQQSAFARCAQNVADFVVSYFIGEDDSGVSGDSEVSVDSGVTDAELLDGIRGMQEAMENPELEVSLTQVKELLGAILESDGKSEKAEALTGMTIEDLVKFLNDLDVLNETHQEKKTNAEAMLFNQTAVGKAYELIGNVLNFMQEEGGRLVEDVRQVLVELKDDEVRSTVSDFKPEALFDGKSFKQLAEDLVSDQLKARNVDNTVFASVTKAGVEHVRGNLAANLSRISDERNLARIGIVMNQCVGDVAEALNKMDVEGTDQDLLDQLGIKMTPDEYKKHVEQRGAANIAKLVSKNPNNVSKESKNLGSKIWNLLFRKIKNTAFKLVRSSIQTGVKESGAVGMVGKMSPTAENMKQLKAYASYLGLEDEVSKFEGHSEIVMLYMFDHLLDEMGSIAAESQGRADPNVSGFETTEDATAALKDSSVMLGRRLAAVQPKKTATPFQHGVLSLAKMFGSNLAQKQGSGDSVADVLTPAFQELGPAWKKWLTE